MINLFLLLIYSITAYGITKVVVFGGIFEGLRNWIAAKSTFLHDLISCPLCFGTWLGFLISSVLILTENITPTSIVFNLPILLTIFLDGCFTAGIVWILYQKFD